MFALGRRQAQIEEAEALVAEADFVEAIGGGGVEGDGLTREAVAEVVGAVFPGDFAFGFDGAHEGIGAVFDGRELCRKGAGAWGVAGGWSGQAEGVVWALVVIDGAPVVEDLLAVGEIEQIGAGEDFGFEGAVEAFFFALGLGMARAAVGEDDAEAHEPESEGGPLAARAAPGRSVVAEEALWETVAGEDLGEVGAGDGIAFARAGAQGEEVAGVIVEQGERVAAAAAAHGDVAFEIHLPEGIGTVVLEALPGLVSGALRGLDAAGALQEGGDGAGGRKSFETEVGEAAAQLARAPGGMLGAQLEERLGEWLRSAMGRALWAAGAIFERSVATGLVTTQPLVAGLAADAKAAAELGEVGVLVLREGDEFETLGHGSGGSPGHPKSVNHVAEHLSAMSPGYTAARLPYPVFFHTLSRVLADKAI